MKVKINGNEKEISQPVTIAELLVLEDVKMPEMVTIEHNNEILERDQFETTKVEEGDEIEFLYFMGGGKG